MRVQPSGVDVVVGDGSGGAAARVAWAGWDGGGAALGCGPLEVTVSAVGPGWPSVSWSVANRGDAAVAVRAVRLVFGVEVDGAAPLRMFRNGYQSWSACDIATFGVDGDPSRAPGAHATVRATFHADAAVADGGELRSEQVTVLFGGGAGEGGPRLLVGFEDGAAHDGTLRLRPSTTGAELVVEAFLGGAVLQPGEARPLHGVVLAEGDRDAALLERWAAHAGRVGGARTGAPYQVGWCSWYHYFHDVTEADLRANLAMASGGGWPFDVFQLDDGYQPAIGDWLTTNERFPSDLSTLAAAIAATGMRAGIWIAPFLAGPGSSVVRDHPEWLAQHKPGSPLVASLNDAWSGPAWALDTSNPEVLDHLAGVAAALVDAGFTYLKLDFTYAPAIGGGYADASMTPAQRVRAGYDAIRRGAGDGAFLLGCGAPLGGTVGVVDGMRIGPDVAPSWEPRVPPLAGYVDTQPATANAWRNTLARGFMHRRLWLNDPDCVMLRTTSTAMSPEMVRSWALAVGGSGGMALVSDDLALLDTASRALLDEVLQIGRAADTLPVPSISEFGREGPSQTPK